jgi:alcohol dehydrogenase
VGAGPIGLSVVEFARRSGGRVRVLDVNPRRRAFVAERWDVEAIAEPDGTLADVVIDATGSAKAMEASFDLVAFGGRLVFVGIVLDRISFADTLFHRREMTVVASRNSHNAFPDIIRRIESGEIDTRPWITHRLALADVPDEFPSLPEAAGLVKAMVEVSDADV